MPFPHKNIRLSTEQYKGQRWHFVTICCAGRRRVFASQKRAVWIVEILRQEATSAHFRVYAYCVMPDHLHILVAGVDATSDLLRFVKEFKQKTSYVFERSFHASLWQKKFYDHILRPRDSIDGVAAYIWLNPVRKGLCADPKAYPFSGSFTLDWMNLRFPNEGWVPRWKSGQEKSARLPGQRPTGTQTPRKAAAT
jgi:putative transposase